MSRPAGVGLGAAATDHARAHVRSDPGAAAGWLLSAAPAEPEAAVVHGSLRLVAAGEGRDWAGEAGRVASILPGGASLVGVYASAGAVGDARGLAAEVAAARCLAEGGFFVWVVGSDDAEPTVVWSADQVS
jgi:hypothetical protein